MFVEMMRLLPKRLADFGVELTVEKYGLQRRIRFAAASSRRRKRRLASRGPSFWRAITGNIAVLAIAIVSRRFIFPGD